MLLKITRLQKCCIGCRNTMKAPMVPTSRPTRISVGRCTPTVTRARDIRILQASSSQPRACIFPFIFLLPRISAAIATLRDTDAWSDGNDLVGRCCMIRLPALVSAVSGLALSIKYWMIRQMIVVTTAAVKIYKAPYFDECSCLMIPRRIYSRSRKTGMRNTGTSAKNALIWYAISD